MGGGLLCGFRPRPIGLQGSAFMAGVLAQGGFSIDLNARGYQVHFRMNESNHCPGCGRAQWYVGRLTAECVFCGTALPLAEAHWSESKALEDRFTQVEQVDWSDRRRYERKAGNGRVLDLLVEGARHSFEVHDISVGGMKGDAPVELAGVDKVEVVFEGGRTVPARVRWTEGELTGLSFTGPVLIDLTRPE